MADYICECNVEGVGLKLSHDIVARFGERTMDVILNEWQRLTEVEKVGRKRAKSLHDTFARMFGKDVEEAKRKENELARVRSMFYHKCGIAPYLRREIESKYGEDKAVATIERNPYQLAEDISGIGFKKADAIASTLGITGDDPRRIRAGLKYVMTERLTNGHCCMLRLSLVIVAANKDHLQLTQKVVAAEMDAAISAGLIAEDMGMIYLPEYQKAEQYVANALLSLRENRKALYGSGDAASYADMATRQTGIKYNDEQRTAISMAATEGVMILTGGPGTGKTTTLRGMLAMLTHYGYTYELCAPTGRAAKRMSEMTGEEARTIHRMLGFQSGQFEYDDMKPLAADVIICDEVSMVDLLLMQSLLKAIKTGGRLILIGDNDQLPSVGPGKVLGDMIDSHTIPTVKLTYIHRQQNGSRIVMNAHRIINGVWPEVNNSKGSDFFYKQVESADECIDEVLTLVSGRLATAYPGMTVQVLCPRRSDTPTCCNKMNELIQEAVNPRGPFVEHYGTIYRKGDRVMQTKNNYAKEVFNGSLGEIVSVVGDMVYVKFDDDDRELLYMNEDLSELDLAYATTIHKSQGSEYDIVILTMMKSDTSMLRRNLVYTAVTRAKKVCIIVGQRDAMDYALRDWTQEKRYTMLKDRLEAGSTDSSR
jgi:exodeoxyribonuclease V alpha subunit